MELESLYDVPGFGGIRSIASEFGTELTVHGGFIRRLALGLRDGSLSSYPEAIAFFSSDIDVLHFAGNNATHLIHAALIERVPFGESIRWQVRSREESADSVASMPFNGIVPANLLTLSTAGNWGIKDEWVGRDDIGTSTYRYIRNGYYKQSPLYRAGRDLEIFSALLYAKVILDDPKVRSFKKQPGCKVAKTVVNAACSSPALLMSLQESAYLRARLLYLLKDIRALAPDMYSMEQVSTAFDLELLTKYLQKDLMFSLGDQIEHLLTEIRPLVITARLGGDQFRLPDSTATWDGGKDDPTAMDMDLPIHGDKALELAEGQKLVLQSPEITINRGLSSSSRSGDLVNEFCHFAVPLSSSQWMEISQYSDDEFAAFLRVSPSSSQNEQKQPFLVSVPCVCSKKQMSDGGTLYVRVNALGFLENAPRLTASAADQPITMQIFVVANERPDPDETINIEDLDWAPAATPSAAPVEKEPADGVNPVPSPREAIVFVHGILSNAADCFKEMKESFQADDRFKDHDFELFDYNYHQPMDVSAKELTRFLDFFLDMNSSVVLVCHSMGGLVARLAVLSGRAPKVRRVIMLCTPNFGAIRTAQLGLLSQMTMYVAGKIYGVFRKPGIRDLTRVTEVFAEPIKNGAAFANDVEYVTIPGEFFNESRPFWDRGDKAVNRKWMSLFEGVNSFSALLEVTPLWRVALSKPHDGIVEAVSNSLIPCEAGRTSEKCATINHSDRFGITYAHVTHVRSSDLTHVTTQHDSQIIDMVKDIVASRDVSAWYSRLNAKALSCIRGVRFSAIY